MRGMRDVISWNVRNVGTAAMTKMFSPRMLDFINVEHELRDDLLPYLHIGATGKFVFASRCELSPLLEELGHRRITVGRQLDFDEAVFAR